MNCEQFALHRLAERAIKESTHREYLASLRALDLSEVDYSLVTIAMINTRLQRVLNQGTRRKHAINIRAALGIGVPCPRPPQKTYTLPPLSVLHAALEPSTYAMWGYVMLYAGLRIGEACTNQPINGNVLTVDRQRLPDGTIATAKTSGDVVIPGWLAAEYPKHDFNRANNTVYIGIRRATRRAGCELNPHALRHAYATNLVKAGASPEVLRRQMRHHDVAVSLRYYVQTTQEDVQEAVRRLAEKPEGLI